MNKFLDGLMTQIVIKQEGFKLMELAKDTLSKKQVEYVSSTYLEILIEQGMFSGNRNAPLLPSGINRRASTGVKFTKAYAEKKYQQRNGTEWSNSPYGYRNLRTLVLLLDKLQRDQKVKRIKALAVTVVIGALACICYSQL